MEPDKDKIITLLQLNNLKNYILGLTTSKPSYFDGWKDKDYKKLLSYLR